jgi:hypothetical protein
MIRPKQKLAGMEEKERRKHREDITAGDIVDVQNASMSSEADLLSTTASRPVSSLTLRPTTAVSSAVLARSSRMRVLALS